MNGRIYRVIKSDELARALELGYYEVSKDEIGGELTMVKNETDDTTLQDLTLPTQSSLFDGWNDFPFCSCMQSCALLQDPAWSVIKDMDNSDRRWAT